MCFSKSVLQISATRITLKTNLIEWLVCSCLWRQVVSEYERAVMFRLGRLLPGARGPGTSVMLTWNFLYIWQFSNTSFFKMHVLQCQSTCNCGSRDVFHRTLYRRFGQGWLAYAFLWRSWARNSNAWFRHCARRRRCLLQDQQPNDVSDEGKLCTWMK